MENLIVNRYMRLIAPLTTETKLELVSKIVENLRSGVVRPALDKEKLLETLYGSWSDMEDTIINDIINSRTA